MIPKAFFVTGGKAVSKVSNLNAFDLALKEAGISQCNLVKVSSIIPLQCKETITLELPIGAITYAVLSKATGRGEIISAGIAWGTDEEHGYGVVAEAYGSMKKEKIKTDLDKRIVEMAKIREIKLGEVRYIIETLDVPNDSFGCAITALVYVL